MNELLNKKRKKITTLSLIITLLIIALTVTIICFTFDHILVMFFVAIILVMFLYLLASKFVMPKYAILKTNIIESCYKTKDDNLNISSIKPFNSELEVFFNKVLINYRDALNINILDNKYFLESISVKDATCKKKEINYTFKGYILKITSPLNFKNDILAIDENYHESKKFINSCNNHFISSNFKSNIVGNKKYYSNIKNKEDLQLLNKITKTINSFNVILYKDNTLMILIKEKNNEFNFNLTNQIDNETLSKCKDSYDNIFKMIFNLEEVYEK